MLDMLDIYQATGFFTPPPLVHMLLSSPASKVRAALQGCRSIEIGSAAVMADELQAFLALVPNARVYVHYGLTECSRAVVLDTTSYPDKLATVGRPVSGVEIMIADEAGRPLPGMHNGQILLRGPQLTSGYWQQPDLNRQRFVDGWLLTGDYGFIDDEGFLTLRGRHDDLINCGGHCYFPDEVEQALGTPAGLEQYLIVGITDPRGVLQQVPWAFVVPVNADEWSPGDFLALARTHLPAHMVPRQVVVVPRLPLTPSGKPDRRETVKLYAPSR
jgi:fatty-acyl-CoA synthase